MDVYMFEHRGFITVKVNHIRANPKDENDVEIFHVSIRQGDSEISINFNNYDFLHDFATALMTEAASARP